MSAVFLGPRQMTALSASCNREPTDITLMSPWGDLEEENGSHDITMMSSQGKGVDIIIVRNPCELEAGVNCSSLSLQSY